MLTIDASLYMQAIYDSVGLDRHPEADSYAGKVVPRTRLFREGAGSDICGISVQRSMELSIARSGATRRRNQALQDRKTDILPGGQDAANMKDSK